MVEGPISGVGGRNVFDCKTSSGQHICVSRTVGSSGRRCAVWLVQEEPKYSGPATIAQRRVIGTGARGQRETWRADVAARQKL